MKNTLTKIYYVLGFPAFLVHEGLHFLFIIIFQAKIIEVKYAIFSKLNDIDYNYYFNMNVEYPNDDIKNFTKSFFVAIAPSFAFLLLIPFPYLIIYFAVYFKLFWLSDVDIESAKISITEIKKRL